MSQVDQEKFAALASGLSAELRRPDLRRCPSSLAGRLGARRPARGGRHRRGHPAGRDRPAGAGRRRRGRRGRRAGQAGRRRGGRRPTTSSPPARDKIDAALTPGRLLRRRPVRDRRARPGRAHRRRRRPVRRRAGRRCGPRARRPGRRRARRSPGCPTCCGSRATPTTCPVTPGGPWPSNWELSAYRATTVLRYLASPTASPEPRMSAAGYGVHQAAGARDRPERRHRQPPRRHRRPVHRLGRGQRTAAGHRRRTPRSHP